MAPEAAFIEEFCTACMEGDLPKVQKALASGLPSRTLEQGLSHATLAAHPDVAAALFDAGAPMTASTISSLGGIDGEQHPDVVRHYLGHGLNPNCTTSNREPLLRFLNAASARELLLRGADPNRCGPKKRAPLAAALASARPDDTSSFDLLVEYGAKVEPSLFFEAIRPRVVDGEFKTQFLLGKGLDPNTISPEWGTPLHRAAYIAKEEIVRILLDGGADPSARSNCRQFGDKSPSEVVETRLKYCPKIPELLASYQAVLELLQRYQR
ncbi:hypothetical protein AbraIFM66950_006489 [Aspergillus brasiliensis]|nr:hypothetical protein AbraIFM66950_006489 [Aspergillus brasiliensis]